MHKEKTTTVFEVCYQDHNNKSICVPVTAEMFWIEEGTLVFGDTVDCMHAFSRWTSVRKMSSREVIQPPSEFTQMQLALIKKKRPV